MTDLHYPPSADTPAKRRVFDRMREGLRRSLATGEMSGPPEPQHMCRACGQRFEFEASLKMHRRVTHHA